MRWKLWVVASLLVLLTVFLLQNTEVVELRLLFWKVEMSRAIMLLAVLAAGVLSGGLLAKASAHSRRAALQWSLATVGASPGRLIRGGH